MSAREHVARLLAVKSHERGGPCSRVNATLPHRSTPALSSSAPLTVVLPEEETVVMFAVPVRRLDSSDSCSMVTVPVKERSLGSTPSNCP